MVRCVHKAIRMNRSIEITFSGVCWSREQTGDNLTETKQSLFEVSYSTTNPIEFDRHIPISNRQEADKLLPQTKQVQSEYPVDITLSANASEITEFAEQVAEKNEESIINVLTRWLQRTNSMRVRRSLHTEIQNKGIDVEPVD